MRLLSRFLLVAGALGVGWFLLRASPRDVVLVYGVPPSPGPAVIEVELWQGDELVRHAELAAPPSGGEVRHPVRLRDGHYALRWRLGKGTASLGGERALDVTEDGTVVIPLSR